MNKLRRSKKKALLESLDELSERMPSLLDIDHPCAQRQIAEARSIVEVDVHCFNCMHTDPSPPKKFLLFFSFYFLIPDSLVD